MSHAAVPTDIHSNRDGSRCFWRKKNIAADLLYLCVEYLQVPRETVGGRLELVPLVDPQTQHSAFSPPAHTRWRPSSAYYLLNNLPPYGAQDKSRQGIARRAKIEGGRDRERIPESSLPERGVSLGLR